MCKLQETVHVVPDAALCVPWLAATASDGRKVVFVRQSDAWMIHRLCHLGTVGCPIFKALILAA